MNLSINYISLQQHVISSADKTLLFEVSYRDGDIFVTREGKLQFRIAPRYYLYPGYFLIEMTEGEAMKDYFARKKGELFWRRYSMELEGRSFLVKQKWGRFELYYNSKKVGEVKLSSLPLTVCLSEHDLENEGNIGVMLALILYYYWDMYLVPGSD